jgi:hypothetical protein
VTRGHFLSPTSDDAMLSVDGCEPHSENFGGTILLTRNFKGWEMMWYTRGIETSQCHKVPLQDTREILVCIGRYGGQGDIWTELYSEDLLRPTTNLMAAEAPSFFAAFDNTLTCGDHFKDEAHPFPITRSFIDKVEFQAIATGRVSAISVMASFGRNTTTPERVLACIRASNGASEFAPTVRSYHLDFVFDGHTYKPTAASAETARMFASE